jgi:hypothetical protein
MLGDRLELSGREGDNIIDALQRFGSVAAVTNATDLQWKKSDEALAKAEVMLNGVLGVLKNRRRMLSGIDSGSLILKSVLLSWPLKLIYCVIGIVIVFIVLSKVL